MSSKNQKAYIRKITNNEYLFFAKHTNTVMLKENQNMFEGTEEHTLSGQVPPHPIQSKNKIYIYIN